MFYFCHLSFHLPWTQIIIHHTDTVTVLCSKSLYDSSGERRDKLVCPTSALCSSLSCISFSPLSHGPPLHMLCFCIFSLTSSAFLHQCEFVRLSGPVVENTTKMSLPVNSDCLSLERIARYRHACSNGSPYATNKPIDIKPRGRRGYDSSLRVKLWKGRGRACTRWGP